MQNSFMQITNDQVIFDKSDLLLYASILVAVIVIIVLILVAIKSRKKDFIKTIPTNLKDEV